jgi:hypothetical protein
LFFRAVEMQADQFRQEEFEYRVKPTLFFGRLSPLSDSDGERGSPTHYRCVWLLPLFLRNVYVPRLHGILLQQSCRNPMLFHFT